MPMKKRLSSILIGVGSLLAVALVYFRVTAAPIHSFDQSWGITEPKIAIDAKIRSMVRRAQFDDYVSGIPPIGRTQLVLISASRSDSGGYHLFFYPKSVSDTLVVYHFSADGKILWKTCTWTET